jgi:DNA mismatch endonuclease (patch repair protein)
MNGVNASSWSAEKRSEVMGAVRSAGNVRTELRFIRFAREFGFVGWRRHQNLAGKPDFIFRREKLALFVDGCFWHGCPRCYRRPSINRKYWDHKVSRNRVRDREVNRVLRRTGWSVVRIWECQLRRHAWPLIARRVRRQLGKRVRN